MTAKIIAHRGASKSFPENTLAAFDAASEMGSFGIELDVRILNNSNFAVHHDATLSDGRDLAKLEPDQLPKEIPLLGQVLPRYGMWINVELKNDDGEPGYDPNAAALLADELQAIEALSGPVNVTVSSFDWPSLRSIREADPTLAIAVLADETTLASQTGHQDLERAIDALIDAAHELEAEAINVGDGLVSKELVSLAHRNDLEVNVWTVDEPLRILELNTIGVDGIITNTPDVALKTLAAPD